MHQAGPARSASDRRRNRAAWVSLGGAAIVLVLKFAAYLVTDSIGFLSDAAESLVNLVAAAVLLIALAVSEAPPDYRHPYGHFKAEYFSSVLEAALIIVAAGAIAWTAIGRLFRPEE
ncbi:MAG TPA: cation diffusion facilitator family transporter, partial [Trueperaceae bacterium]|nr:cation diffusion facilitator family transporter [Trueperaceae bacterium]